MKNLLRRKNGDQLKERERAKEAQMMGDQSWKKHKMPKEGGLKVLQKVNHPNPLPFPNLKYSVMPRLLAYLAKMVAL